MAGFLSNLGFAVLTVVLSFLVLVLVVSPPQLEATGPRVETSDGRLLSYSIRGNQTSTNCIIWLHGLLSSRYETLGAQEDILEDLDAFIVSFDRPGYGESLPHRGRDFVSSTEDIIAIADYLGVKKFFLVGVSAGGSYAWAAATLLPARVRGVLLLSSAGPQGLLSEHDAELEFTRYAGTVEGFLRKAMRYSWPTAAFQMLAETYVGGRALFSAWLEGVAQRIYARMSEVDARCIMKHKRQEYNLRILPESVKQGTATPVVQDILLIMRPWPFNISAIPDQLAAAIHIWHGTGDPQVPSDYALAFKREVPKARLRIIEGGGHYAYWVCNAQQQREALTQLLKWSLPA